MRRILQDLLNNQPGLLSKPTLSVPAGFRIRLTRTLGLAKQFPIAMLKQPLAACLNPVAGDKHKQRRKKWQIYSNREVCVVLCYFVKQESPISPIFFIL
jgi:hypothetical protein